MTNRGASMIEMVMAIILVGLVGGVIHGMLAATRRAHQRQVQIATVNSTVRAATSILEPVFRELNAGDAAGSDIVSLSSTSMTFKMGRNVYFLCQAPDAPNTAIWVGQEPSFGQAGFTGLDSLLLYFEGDPLIRTDDRWLHTSIVSAATGAACPGSTPSVYVTLGGVTSAQLDSVFLGAPVRGFEVVEVALYVDGGERWLGSRRFSGGAWTAHELLVGPMDAGGLSFQSFDDAGNITVNPALVARVALLVTGRTQAPVSNGSSMKEWATADLTTDMTLRNNPRF